MPSRLDTVDLTLQFPDEAEYNHHLKKWQLRMLEVEEKLDATPHGVIVALEGWDASGKDGAIKRLIEPLNPRGYTVVPIGAPTPEELAHHYLWRFWTRTPAKGQMVIFDRTWYGRVLVERVEKLTPKVDWERAYGEINEFERLLTDSGVTIIKFWLHISEDEQLKRFEEREKSPFKRWKITPDDWRNRKKWGAYQAAVEEMLERTETLYAPWHLIAGEHKWWARVEILKTVVKQLEAMLGVKGKD